MLSIPGDARGARRAEGLGAVGSNRGPGRSANFGGADGASAGSGPLTARTCAALSASGAALTCGTGAAIAASPTSAPAWATTAPAGVGLSIMLEASLEPVATRAATSAEVRRRSSCSRSQRSSVALRGRGAPSVRTRPVLTVCWLRSVPARGPGALDTSCRSTPTAPNENARSEWIAAGDMCGAIGVAQGCHDGLRGRRTSPYGKLSLPLDGRQREFTDTRVRSVSRDGFFRSRTPARGARAGASRGAHPAPTR